MQCRFYATCISLLLTMEKHAEWSLKFYQSTHIPQKARPLLAHDGDERASEDEVDDCRDGEVRRVHPLKLKPGRGEPPPL